MSIARSVLTTPSTILATAACSASSSLPTRAAKRCSTRCSTRTECSVSAEAQQWFITTVRIVRPRSDSGLDHCNGASSSEGDLQPRIALQITNQLRPCLNSDQEQRGQQYDAGKS